MAKYYYNGVLLPEIPADVLAEYPYAWISLGDDGATYNLNLSPSRWFWTGQYVQGQTPKWYKATAESDSFTLFASYTNTRNFGIYKGVVWSNFDIPNGSATSTDIYFEGSEPVPEGEQEPDVPGRTSGYIIRSNSTLYTITDGALTALAETEITASLFQTYGVDDLPDGSLLVGLTDPEVLYWQASDGELPTLTITVKGTPPLPQMFTSEPMDLTHESIAGISHAAVDASEDVRFAISFDGGTTWKAFDGSAWFDTSDTVPGMLPSTMNAITAEQWAEVVELESYMVRFWLPNVTAYVKSVVMHYINP